MKLKMSCPKCGSDKISIVENEEGSKSPMYKCGKCGYKARLFPAFESDKDNAEEDAMDEEDDAGEDEEELNSDQNEETEQF